MLSSCRHAHGAEHLLRKQLAPVLLAPPGPHVVGPLFGQLQVSNRRVSNGLKTDHAAAMVQKPRVGSEGGQALVRCSPSLCSRVLRQILDTWSTGKQKTLELPLRGGRSNTCIIITYEDRKPKLPSATAHTCL